MMTHRNLGVCSSRTLLGVGALLALSIGCATAGAPKSPETGALPDEEEWAPGKKPGPAAAAAPAPSGPTEVPLITRKPSGREITEDQKASYDKAVAEYLKACLLYTSPSPRDCS